jgi:hypothetical protein
MTALVWRLHRNQAILAGGALAATSCLSRPTALSAPVCVPTWNASAHFVADLSAVIRTVRAHRRLHCHPFQRAGALQRIGDIANAAGAQNLRGFLPHAECMRLHRGGRAPAVTAPSVHELVRSVDSEFP